MKQINLLPKSKKTFGPEDLRDKRKEARALSSRHAIHLILKSSRIKEFGSFYKHKKLINDELMRFSKKFGVKIFKFTIMHDHIHLIIQIQNRKAYNHFVQAFTGSVALKIVKLSDLNKTLAPNKETMGFWQSRPYTRILEWGRDYKTTQDYLYQNEMEGLGLARYHERNANTIDQRLILFTDQMQREETLSYEEHMGLGQMNLIRDLN